MLDSIFKWKEEDNILMHVVLIIQELLLFTKLIIDGIDGEDNIILAEYNGRKELLDATKEIDTAVIYIEYIHNMYKEINMADGLNKMIHKKNKKKQFRMKINNKNKMKIKLRNKNKKRDY